MLSSSPEVTPTQEIHDCVVVGMGAMGSAAVSAHRLALCGCFRA